MAVLLRAMFLIHNVTLFWVKLPRALNMSIYNGGIVGVAFGNGVYTLC